MKNENDNENLISHLEALRETLLKCFISLGVVLPFMLYIAPRALNYFIKILIKDNDIQLNFFSPAEVFILQIKIAILMDFIVCFPYIAKKIWNFILPALYDNEKKFIKSTVFLSSSLFIFGVLFCLFLILPLIINFGMSFSNGNIHALFGISNVINLSLWLCLAFGIMFQMPLIANCLINLGIISYESLSNKRPYVVVILLILAAVLTPPDIVSQLLLFIPTYTLFEAGLLFSKKKVKND